MTTPEMSESVRNIRPELAALRSIPCHQARAMIASYYTYPDFPTLERERLFRNQWICVGHIGEAPSAGDYFTTELVGIT